MSGPTYFGGHAPGSDGGKASMRWWRVKDPVQRANGLVARARRIEQASAPREQRSLVFEKLKSDQDLSSLYQSFAPNRPRLNGGGDSLIWNVTRSCSDTACAKIAKNKPRPRFLTSGGDWAQRRRAKLLTTFVDGLFDAARTYEHAQRAFADCTTHDCGFVKVYREGSKIRHERVLPTEILVDDGEAINGDPRSLYHRKYIHRDVLLERFGDVTGAIDAIEKARSVDATNGATSAVASGDSDMIAVYEGWHLRSGEDAKDGRHCIALDGCELLCEPWDRDYFPFGIMRWSLRGAGFWGQGLVEQLAPIQFDISRTLKVVADAQRLMAVPTVLIERGSKVVKAHINNGVGNIIEYTGTPPVWHIGTAVSPEIYQWLETQYQKAYELTGLSQLTANGKKPEGLDAAVAMRELNDIESERFMPVAQRYEQMFLDLARISIDLARDIYAEGKAVKVKAPGTDLIEEIDWKDVNLEEDQYVMRVFPASMLPTTPSGKLQMVKEMMDMGLVDQTHAGSLLQFPDIESVTNLSQAGYDDVHRIIGRIIDDGEYETPEPYMPLDLAIKEAQSAMLKSRADKVPDAHRLLLSQFIDDCKELADQIRGQEAATMPVDPMAQLQAQAAPQGAPIAPQPMPGVDPAAAGMAQMPVDPNMPPPVEGAPEVMPPEMPQGPM